MADDVLDALLEGISGQFSKHDDSLATVLAMPAPIGIGDSVRFEHLHERWIIWDGTRWRVDQTKRIYDLTRRTINSWLGSKGLDKDDKVKLLPATDVSKKNNILRSLGTRGAEDGRPAIAMNGDEWDQNGYMVGFDNGIFDLMGQKFLVPDRVEAWEDVIDQDVIDPTLLISKSVGVDFDPMAKCPIFDQFLGDIMWGDAEMKAYLWRLIGYSLIGTTKEQKFWMWVGRGSNGKGILARTLHHVFGDYAFKPTDSLYMRSRMGSARSDGARPDLLDLQGVRFTFMSEPPGNQFDENMLKAHSGEDTITARALYSNHEAQFPPTHKIVFLTNDPPKTDDVGVSMSRRVRVIQFERDYSGNDPESRPDKDLEDKLKAEAQGILNRALVEAIAWIERGLPEPAKVARWSREYIAENDPLAPFVTERCETGNAVVGPAHALWASYEDWSAKRGDDPMSQTGFGLALARKYEKRRTAQGNVYKGIRAKGAMELADAGAE